MWSVGALLELEDRAKLEEFIRGNAELKLHLPVLPHGSDHTMFDYFVDNEGRFQWLASFAFHPMCFVFIKGLISSYGISSTSGHSISHVSSLDSGVLEGVCVKSLKARFGNALYLFELNFFNYISYCVMSNDCIGTIIPWTNTTEGEGWF